MTGLFIFLGSITLLCLAGRIYSRFLARQWGEQADRATPAVSRNDGRDFVPTPTPIVFAHHFASIAGAGPILGPVLALCFGWKPALLWVLVGGILIGGVHDYLVAFMSIRSDGCSVATIARRILGRGPFLAFMLFLVILLGLVTAVFLNTSASALVSMLDLGRMHLDPAQKLFRVISEGASQKVVIGGIASMSVIIITLLAPLVGWMAIKRNVSVWKCSLVAILICAASILGGLYFPVSFPSVIKFGPWQIVGVSCWKFLLAAYTLVAAGVPVWVFLQSRDFINVHILYAGIAFLFSALVVASLRGNATPAEAALPAYDAAMGAAKLGTLWPGLFITIACGAVSGFHSLCAGGTTCKQLKTEPDARAIGYWAMLLETVLAVAVICVFLVGTNRVYYMEDVFPIGRDNNPILGFAFAVGSVGHAAFGMPLALGALAGMLLLEGFVITTLDTAVRLNRYLIEELWQEFFGGFDVFAGKIMHDPAAGSQAKGAITQTKPAIVATSGVFRWFLVLIRQYWVNSGLAVALMLALAFSGNILQLWTIFGTANQLLAAFALGLGAIWLLRNGRNAWCAILPASFMLATTATSLILLVRKFMPVTTADGVSKGSVTLFVADLTLIALTAYLVFAGVRELMRRLGSR